MQTSSVLVWINCYGAWDPLNRKPVEMIGYDQYLDGIVSALEVIKEKIESIHLSGGMLDEMGRTECATTKPELEKRLKAVGINCPIIVDEESITSAEIVKKFLATISTQPDTTPLLFCDMVRTETNTFYLEEYAKQFNVTINTRDILVPIARLDNHPNSTPEAQSEKLAEMKQQGIDAIDQKIATKRREQSRQIQRSI
jgi:hypothetical protein